MNKVRVTKTRRYSAHHTLMRIAQNALHEAKRTRSGSWDNLLISITFSALTLEAFANAAGGIVARNEADFALLDFEEKIKRLCRILTVRWDNNKQPWATVVWLHKFRNKIAHPKPEFFSVESMVNVKAHVPLAANGRNHPLRKW